MLQAALHFCDWRHSILTFQHCTNYLPGLLAHGELSDFAGLIAPRPGHGGARSEA